jgi:hypothetical protein
MKWRPEVSELDAHEPIARLPSSNAGIRMEFATCIRPGPDRAYRTQRKIPNVFFGSIVLKNSELRLSSAAALAH